MDKTTYRKNRRSASQKPGKVIGMAPFDSYNELSRQENNELKRLSTREAIRRLEILLELASECNR